MPTYPLTIPTGKIRDITLRQVRSQARTESPFSKQVQVVTHTGERWEADVVLRPLSYDDAGEWKGFLSNLRGMVGTFLMGDPDYPGREIGAVKVNGGHSAGAQSLALKGLEAPLRAGDMIGLPGNHLHMVERGTEGATPTVDIFPRLRAGLSGDEAVNTTSPLGLWRLANPEVSWQSDQLAYHDIRFVAIEAI